jgi:hypothetical protein
MNRNKYPQRCPTAESTRLAVNKFIWTTATTLSKCIARKRWFNLFYLCQSCLLFRWVSAATFHSSGLYPNERLMLTDLQSYTRLTQKAGRPYDWINYSFTSSQVEATATGQWSGRTDDRLGRWWGRASSTTGSSKVMGCQRPRQVTTRCITSWRRIHELIIIWTKYVYVYYGSILSIIIYKINY